MLGKVVWRRRGQDRDTTRQSLEDSSPESFTIRREYCHFGGLYKRIDLFLFTDIVSEIDRITQAQRFCMSLQRFPLRSIADNTAGRGQALSGPQRHPLEQQADSPVAAYGGKNDNLHG